MLPAGWLSAGWHLHQSEPVAKESLVKMLLASWSKLRHVGLAAPLVIALGCGSNVDDGTDRPDTGVMGDSGTNETASDVGGDDMPPDGAVPLENVCDVIASAACSSNTTTCCTASGFTFDEKTCRSRQKQYCDEQVAVVKAGKATYDATKIPGCVAAWKDTFSKCKVSLTDELRAGGACALVFRGTITRGSPCTSDGECKAPEGGLAACGSSKLCEVLFYGEAKADEPCRTNGYQCAAGLQCTGDNVCKPATPIGGACPSAMDQSCGFGNFCNALKCAAGLPAGSACGNYLECASWQCVSSKCSDPTPPFANKFRCGV